MKIIGEWQVGYKYVRGFPRDFLNLTLEIIIQRLVCIKIALYIVSLSNSFSISRVHSKEPFSSYFFS
jgi:hypothetical protein